MIQTESRTVESTKKYLDDVAAAAFALAHDAAVHKIHCPSCGSEFELRPVITEAVATTD